MSERNSRTPTCRDRCDFRSASDRYPKHGCPQEIRARSWQAQSIQEQVPSRLISCKSSFWKSEIGAALGREMVRPTTRIRQAWKGGIVPGLRYWAHPSQIMRWSRSLMRVKTGSIRSMDSDTNPVTSVQRGVIRARNSVSMRVSVIHGSEDSTLSPMASHQAATGSRWVVEQGPSFLHGL
jgi:hypothetical protein